jgi:hypothetical protein
MIYIDSTYELIEACVLDKIQKLKSLKQVYYFYHPRNVNRVDNLLYICKSKGLNCFPSQYFIDHGTKYQPDLSGEKLTKKHFLCLTGKITPYRTFLIALLSKFNLLDYGYVSFFHNAVDKNFDNGITDNYLNSNLSSYAKNIIKEELNKIKLPLIVDEPNLSRSLSHKKTFNAVPYQAVNFVIVPETNGSLTYNEFFVTEKTIKCVLTNKKFIPVASQHFLKNLKEYYKLLDTDISNLVDWYDNSFDILPSTEERIERIVEIVKNTIESTQYLK